MGSLANLTDHYLAREREYRSAKAKFEEAVGNLGTARTLLANACERFAITEYFHNGRFVRIDKGTPRVVDKLIHNSSEISWPDHVARQGTPVLTGTDDPDDAEVSELVADLRATAAKAASQDNSIG